MGKKFSRGDIAAVCYDYDCCDKRIRYTIVLGGPYKLSAGWMYEVLFGSDKRAAWDLNNRARILGLSCYPISALLEDVQLK